MRCFRVFLFCADQNFPFIFHLRFLPAFYCNFNFLCRDLFGKSLLVCLKAFSGGLYPLFEHILRLGLSQLELMSVDLHRSQCYKRTHILLLLKTAHSRDFIILLNFKPQLVRQRLIKQLIVNVNIPRPVSRIFVNGDVLDQLQAHLAGKLGNVCIFL